ncbi:N,N-dimethylformamidase beta subunit family domain-containing protein [Gloeocapsa sp. BRSZ]
MSYTADSHEEFLIAQVQTNQTIFTTQTPSIPNASDGVPYELGMKFRSAKAGEITAIRYWKAANETGSHVGKIWTATGTLLSSVTFTNESTSGWQQQTLNTPQSIAANTTYVISVNANSHFPITYNGLETTVTNGDLSSVADGNNGVFASQGSFPSSSYQNSNYFRDVVFVVTSSQTITKVSGDNQTGTAGTTLPAPLVAQVKDAAGNPQSGVTINFTVDSGGGSVSPTSAVTDTNGQASTVLTLGAAPGAIEPVINTVSATASGIGSVTFSATANPTGNPTTQTLFTNQVPGISNASDGVAYELGTKFQSSAGGQITAIRYWKAPSETGTHVGKIWTAGGQVLATVNFTNESASGWQQQELSTPVYIDPNTTYVVSVNCNSHFALTYNQLANSVVNGPLRTVADGNNGVYGSFNSFPTSSYQNSNYFRDIVFIVSSTVNKVSGDNQSGTVGSTLPNPLVIRVENSAGNPQAGVTVSFTVDSGGGSVSPNIAVTNSSGLASTSLTLGSIPSGPNNAVVVTATASGIGSVIFTAKAIPENPNAIYLENLQQGTTNWKITNQAFNEIAGYATATSVNKGGSLPIKVSLAQSGQFTVDVYRLGYYGGRGGRLVASSGLLNGITQPAGTLNSTTRLFECNWSTSYTIAVGANWTSGLYIAKLTDQRTGKQSQIWFVVRDDSSNSKILFQSSFTTFLAYSNTGGYSLYSFNSIGGQRAFKISYDCPFSQTGVGFGEFNNIFRWEYNMVRWLESQSYDVSYITNMDVQNNSQLLQQHQVFLSVGHDEYWSLEERNHVEQARNSGVNLGFFSANTCYWRVRFENSTSGVADRVMACYKDAWNLDPVAAQNSSAATNKFRSPQNNKPESALLGVMYVGDIDIVYGGFDFVIKNSNHPYYANTGLNNGDRLSQLVGFEWDAINPNASPNGLEILAESQSPQAPDNVELEGFPAGTNPRVSHAVRYVAASGAKVFATGSIQWMWGLDSDGVSTPREDLRAKQIAVNILADMGAKPLTPDPDIIVP